MACASFVAALFGTAIARCKPFAGVRRNGTTLRKPCCTLSRHGSNPEQTLLHLVATREQPGANFAAPCRDTEEPAASFAARFFAA
jgi:hypothetical protein